MMLHAYETDGAAIYARSFSIIRAEAALDRFDIEEEPVVVRMIHALGMVGLEAHVRITPGEPGSETPAEDEHGFEDESQFASLAGEAEPFKI